MNLSDATREKIEAYLDQNRVVLFMKGNPSQPMCGFSAKTAGILDGLLEAYTSVDVLADQDIREGIKAYGQWPTIPQLYIDKELIGGCDIVTAMYNNGELHEALGLCMPHGHHLWKKHAHGAPESSGMSPQLGGHHSGTGSNQVDDKKVIAMLGEQDGPSDHAHRDGPRRMCSRGLPGCHRWLLRHFREEHHRGFWRGWWRNPRFIGHLPGADDRVVVRMRGENAWKWQWSPCELALGANRP